MVGLGLQLIVPAAVVAEGRGAVGSVIGVLALLIALVLGLLIWTSFGVFSSQQIESNSLRVTTLQLDYLLEQYGPEAIPGRMGLRASVKGSRERFFSGKGPETETSYERARQNLHGIDSFFATLHPQDDERKQLLATAKPMALSIVHTQLMMTRQLINPVPSLLLVMVQVWASLLFLGFGVMGNVSVFSVIADAAGAFAIASAIFLIIEFSEPYSGLFRISPAGIDKVISELAAHAPAASPV